jgi:hypothetical protein
MSDTHLAHVRAYSRQGLPARGELIPPTSRHGTHVGGTHDGELFTEPCPVFRAAAVGTCPTAT